MKSGMLDEALGYVRKGWPVLPLHGTNQGNCTCRKPDCGNQGKHPRAMNGVNDATTDETTIKQWWKKWPDANVGIATGEKSVLVVLDIDDRNDGEDSLVQLQTDYGELPNTVESLTSGGGRHLIFQHPGNGTKIKNVTNLSGFTGIDIKGDGGYIVAPPSIHLSGKPYNWEMSSHPDEMPIAPLPDWLLKLMTTPQPTEGLQESNNFGWVVEALDGVMEGSRDRTCFRLAGHFKAKGLAYDVTLRFLNDWATKCTPPFPENQVTKCVDSAYKYPDESTKPTMETRLMWAKDMEPLQGGGIQSIWGDFLFPGSIHLLSGEAGVSKTTLLYNLAISGTKGEPFLDIPFAHPVRVLYLDLESPDILRRQKLNLISEGNRPDGLAFISAMNIEQEIQGLTEIVQLHGFELLIVDTINEAFDTLREDDNSEANRHIQILRKLVNQTGVSVMLVHHLGKRAQESSTYKARGASARPASADIVMNLEREAEDVVRLEIAKSRWPAGGSQLHLKKVGEDRFELTEPIGQDDYTLEYKAQNAIIEILKADEMQRKDILAKLIEQGFTMSTADRALSKLTKLGRVRRLERGWYCLPETSG